MVLRVTPMLLFCSMLEERDKLMEKLRECQESYNESTKKLSLVEADNGILMRQLQALMPDVSYLKFISCIFSP